MTQDLFSEKLIYVDVVLPLPLNDLFTFHVPEDLQEDLQEGARAIVQFGDKKIYTAIIVSIHHDKPTQYDTKPLLDVLDSSPLIQTQQFKLFEWIASYYMSSIGNVIKNAIPSGLKISSESNIQLNPDADLSQFVFTLLEQLIIDQLHEKKSLNYDEISKITNASLAHKTIKKLSKLGVILTFEKAKERYSPKVEKYIRISESILETNELENTINTLEKKPKQLEILLGYLRKVPIFNNPALNKIGLIKKELKGEPFSASSLKTLIKNQILVEDERIISRFDKEYKTEAIHTLSKAQEESLHNIYNQFEAKDTVLLHGVTGSGKTEIYIQMIQDAIDNGTQALYLLPEIALTTQIVVRLRAVFGSKLGVYHSRFSDNERVDTWKDLINDKTQIIVGVRSSIFLPFNNLGLIIVDEEHDASYKQHDPSPRYNARDTAIILANIHQAKVLLGSATPSVETYYKALTAKFGLVTLSQRYGKAQLPDIIPTQNKQDKKAGHNFASQLTESIQDRLNKQEQSIIFQNRRGYSPYIQCEACETIPQCKNCNVNLTYHMYINELRCHYCGHSEPPTQNCNSCGSTKMHTRGHGTEKIEDNLKLVFPDAVVQRMDLDTTRKKNSLETIIERFDQKQIDILVGTQMISKGLDFDNVTLVGVFDADRTLNFPDYKSKERTFQLITQVSGRAGRKAKKGEVIIQTANPNHQIFEHIKNHNYNAFYKEEIKDREAFFYPPFARLIKITVKHLEQKTSIEASNQLAKLLKVHIQKKHVLGPQEPIINKVRNLYINEIIVKVDSKSKNLLKIKSFIYERIRHLGKDKKFRQAHIVIDIDPV